MERKIYLYTNEVLSMINGEYFPPISCEIDLSNKCQLKCSFCMYSSYRKEEGCHLDRALYQSLIHQLKSIGTKSITFTGGGEPLANPHAAEMIDLAFKEGFDIGLITNGVDLYSLPVYLLNSFKFIRVSLDAASREVYKKVKRADFYDLVIDNISKASSISNKKVVVGISYVICEDNEHEVYEAEKLSRELNADYVQFKPAWRNGGIYDGLYMGENEEQDPGVFVANRWKPTDSLPCVIAGLIGIVGANGKLYYCCQHRGKVQYELGDLTIDSFDEIWRRRKYIDPSIKECPQCRYMSYAKKFREIPGMLINHRNFL